VLAHITIPSIKVGLIRGDLGISGFGEFYFSMKTKIFPGVRDVKRRYAEGGGKRKKTGRVGKRK